MSPPIGTVQLLAEEFAVALQPLMEALKNTETFHQLLMELGWEVPEGAALLGMEPAHLSKLEDVLQGLGGEESGEGASGADHAELIATVALVVAHVRDVADQLGNHLDGGFLSVSGMGQEFPRRLYDFLIVEYIADGYEPLTEFLSTIGIVELQVFARDEAQFRSAHVRRVIHYSRLQHLFGNPVELLEKAYAWGTSDSALDVLLQRLHDLFLLLGFLPEIEFPDLIKERNLAAPVVISDEGEAEHGELRIPLSRATDRQTDEGKEFGITVFPVPAIDGSSGPGLALCAYSVGDAVGSALPLDLEERWTLAVQSDLDLARQVGIILRPSRPLKVISDLMQGGEETVGSLAIALTYRRYDDESAVSLRTEEGSFLRAQIVRWRAGLRTRGAEREEVFTEIALEQSQFRISPERFDSFLRDVTGGRTLESNADFGIGWSSSHGAYLVGSATLKSTLAVYRRLGPFTAEAVSLSIEAEAEEIDLALVLSGAVRLGPLTVTVRDVGFALTVAFPDDGGNLGMVDVSTAFHAPEGLGISLEAGPITGGGFLAYDDATGRYAGAVELEVHDISVKAIGLLDTRIPGGKPAYSFVLLISAEFAPISLGFGFTLNGVGGLAGIHRRMEVEALRTRLRQGSLDHLLFSKDPIKNAGRIVSDLQVVFPPAANRYVFGLMAIIGWGTPMLLEGRLGTLLESPDPARLVLLGQFHMALPRNDKTLIDLNLDVLGEIDPHRQRIALDGRLCDSHVVSFPIEGEVAMRLLGGDSPNFALAIGGFHPAYTPPPGFPKLQRVAILIGIDDNPRITLQGYLALTSNTLQVGAAAALYAEKGWFNISGEISFNALFTFSPFSFVTDFSGKVALRKGNTDLAAVSLKAVLSGPTPWHAAGKACLELRWLPDICVGFSATFGREERVPLPKVDPWPLLQAAFQSPESWSGAQPSGGLRGATLARAAGAAGGVLVDPAFGVTLRQAVVPLHRRITKFGEAQPPGGPDRFDVQTMTIAGKDVPDSAWSTVQDFFAPAQFEQLTDDEKLSRPSFERMDAGLTFAQEAVSHGPSVGMKVEYETMIIDSAFETRRAGVYFPVRDVQLAVAQRGAAGRAPLRNSGSSKFAPPPARPPIVQLAAEQYIVASTLDLAARTDINPPAGKGAAYQALAAYLASHPGEHGQLEVIALDELAEV